MPDVSGQRNVLFGVANGRRESKESRQEETERLGDANEGHPATTDLTGASVIGRVV